MNVANWTQLATKVFRAPMQPTDVIFVHAWADLVEETAALVGSLYAAHPQPIILNGLKEFAPGRPHISIWKQLLTTRYSIPEDMITVTPTMSQTREEAEGFLTLAFERGFTYATVVSVPQHIVRAFLTDLGIMQEKGLSLSLFPQTPQDINWFEDIYIPATTPPAHELQHCLRIGRVFGECARIFDYRKRYEAGDKTFAIASIEEGLTHLDTHTSRKI